MSLTELLCCALLRDVTHARTTAQHIACAKWHKCSDFAATVAALIKHGADKEATTLGPDHQRLWQPIHFVAANAGHSGSAAAMKLLIVEHSIAVDTLTEDLQQPCTPAWLVARHSCADSDSSADSTEHTLQCLQQLLALGADLHTTERGGLLCAAAASGNTRVAQFLFDKGLQLPAAAAGAAAGAAAADADAAAAGAAEAPEMTAQLPLHAAAQLGHTAMVKLLLRRGARVNERDRHGATPLRCCLAAPCDEAELFKVLVAAGNDPLDVAPALTG
jgi:Ankyrin repeats (3 copies)